MSAPNSQTQPLLPEALREGQSARLDVLMQRFPSQFPLPSYQYTWPPGWDQLVLRACETLHRQRPEARWVQIKEKFGGLRLYFEGGPMVADIHTAKGLVSLPVWDEERPRDLDCHELMMAIQQESLRNCACCSAPGELTKVGSYYVTLCTDCAQRHGAVFVRPQQD